MTPTTPGAFEPLVYVYDVGADPSVAALGDAIERFIELLVREEIDRVQFVIVSHIDQDHVNRLDLLIKSLKMRNISVGKLMIPWLDPLSRLFALSRTKARQSTTVVRNLLREPTAVVRYAADLGVEEVVFVLPDSRNSDDAPRMESVTNPEGVVTHGSVSPSGVVPLPPNSAPWVLMLSHLEPPKKTLRWFRNRVIKRTGLDPMDPTNHMKLLRPRSKRARRANRKRLASAMGKAARRSGLKYGRTTITNWSSMTLYGSSTLPHVQHVAPASPGDFSWECAHGWLHTGDFPVNDRRAWREIKRAWRRGFGKTEVCALVAPHHGSKLTHRSALYKRFAPTVVLFTFGLLSSSSRGRPKYAKLIDPLPAQRYVRSSTSAKVRPLNNRP